jgi:hypothetical protein
VPSTTVPWGRGGAPSRWRRSKGVLAAGATVALPQSWGHDDSCGAGNPRWVGWWGLNGDGSGAVGLGWFGVV